MTSARDVLMRSDPPCGIASRAFSAMFRIAASSVAASTRAIRRPARIVGRDAIVAPIVRPNIRTIAVTSALMSTGWGSGAGAARTPAAGWSDPCRAASPCMIESIISSTWASRRFFGQVMPQQLDVAEDHREDVVEVVRDAAGELPDRFHLLRPEQRFPRLVQRFVRRLQLRDVVRDAEEPEDAGRPGRDRRPW